MASRDGAPTAPVSLRFPRVFRSGCCSLLEWDHCTLCWRPRPSSEDCRDLAEGETWAKERRRRRQTWNHSFLFFVRNHIDQCNLPSPFHNRFQISGIIFGVLAQTNCWHVGQTQAKKPPDKVWQSDRFKLRPQFSKADLQPNKAAKNE